MATIVRLSSMLFFAVINSMYFDDLGQICRCRWYPGTFQFHSPGCNPWGGRLPVAKPRPRRLEQRQE